MVSQMFRTTLVPWLFGSMLLLTSCAVGPDYSAPEHAPPAAFIDDLPAETAVEIAPEPVSAWWELLGDEMLNELIEMAVQANYDIQTIQRLLGHANIKTTMVYLHVMESKTRKELVSPLDLSQEEIDG